MNVSPTPVQARQGPGHLLLVLAGVLVGVGIAATVMILSDAFDSSSGSGQLVGSGNVVTERRDVPPFTSIALAGSSEVRIKVGSAQSVVVQADDNLFENVTTRVEAGRLVIGTTGSFTTKGPMSVTVTVPSLEGIALSGSGVIVAEDLRGDTLTVELPGSGVVVASGKVDRLDVVLPGSGAAELGGLEARDVDALVSGSGNILVQATGSLDAEVSGTGVITYTGSPVHVTRNVTGTGAITGN